jgi:hypothetical protein
VDFREIELGVPAGAQCPHTIKIFKDKIDLDLNNVQGLISLIMILLTNIV